jgi:anti-sigma factor (TIGR02949 family)
LSEICNEVLEELERFIDGELPADKIADLAAHLNECPPCLYRADFQAKLKEILRNKCSAASAMPRETFVMQVRRSIRTEVRYIDEV